MVKLDNDVKELVRSYAASLLEGYKIVLACLLSVFVPQLCPETQQTCTFRENFSNLSDYNILVIVINFLCLAFFLRLSYRQNKRETYLITHLDASREYAVSAFETNSASFPNVVIRVKQHNRNVIQAARQAAFVFVINTILSAVLVCHFYYDGFRTVTTLITNVLLVSGQLFNVWSVLTECTCTEGVELALSTYQTTPIGYNVLDKDYVERKRGKVELTTVVSAPTAAGTKTA